MTAESLAKIQVDGEQIGYRRIGNGQPLLVLSGFAATSADWDPSFIDGLASSNDLILLDHRGIGSSTDDGKAFDVAQLASDAAHVIETLGFERTSVLGWSMGGFIAQTLALQHPDRVNKLILLSTDPGGAQADLASTAIWSQLIDMSGTPHEQARRLLSLLFPTSWRLRARGYLLTW
jgi:pimeloyl-ACP methyl ester carboxylesterase